MANNDNIIYAKFNHGHEITTDSRSQYAYGQVVKISGLHLPASFDADIANKGDKQAKAVIGTNNELPIDDNYFLSGKDIIVMINVHATDKDGRTKYIINIPINKRSKRADIELEPVEQDVVSTAIATLNEAVERTSADVESAENSASRAHESAISAEQSATNAFNSEELTQQYMERAETAAESSEKSETKAKASEESAKQSESHAEQIANDIEQFTERAETAANLAEQKATEASASADTATAKAKEADTSATNAERSSLNAQDSVLIAQDYMDSASDYANQAEVSATKAKSSADDAELSKSNAEKMAMDAEESKQYVKQVSDGFDTRVEQAIDDVNTTGQAQKELAKEQAEKAEAWAVGERRGSPIKQDDPAYNNNAKYWAGQAHTDSESASSDAQSASTSATSAAESAYEASKSADRAEHAAEGVEGYAERAEAAQQASESARDIALEAKVSAAASAATASEKASEAISSATTASQSALTAETASESARASATASAESASQASQSADTASGKASDASEYASNANTSAQTASQKASEAARSASSASQAKTDAETAKQASETAQGLAESARDGAVGAKTGAESARDKAQEIVDGITGKVEQIDSNTDRIESLEDDRYKPYPTDTASGSIASSPDGADGIPLKSCIVRVEPVQAGSGDPSPDNVRPITGWTGCEVQRTGKNLCPIHTMRTSHNGIDYTVTTEGIKVHGTATSTSYSWIDRINTYKATWLKIPAGSYTFSVTDMFGTSQSNGYVVFMGFDIDGTAVTNLVLYGGNRSIVRTFTKPVGLYYGIYVKSGLTVDTVVKIQVELGSTATAYEPYSRQTYPIIFPSEAGTVYGGSLTIAEDGSGVLTVDRAMADMGSLVWNYNTTYAFFTSSSIPTRKIGILNVWSDLFKTMAGSWSGTPMQNALWGNGSNTTLYVQISSLDNVDDFMALVDGHQLMYELATPIHYPLTPTEIKTLLGQNNVWADTGDVSVEYRADTKLYIEKLTQPEEDDMIADSAISKGRFFMVGNSLYRALANIASGATITVGTNAQRVSLSDALNLVNA